MGIVVILTVALCKCLIRQLLLPQLLYLLGTQLGLLKDNSVIIMKIDLFGTGNGVALKNDTSIGN